MSENTPAPVGPDDVEGHIVQKWFDGAEQATEDVEAHRFQQMYEATGEGDGDKPLRAV